MTNGGDIFAGTVIILMLLSVPALVLFWGFRKTNKMNLERDYENHVSWPRSFSIAFAIIWVVYFVAVIGGDMVSPQPASASSQGFDRKYG